MLTLECAQQLELVLPSFLVQACPFRYVPFKSNTIELCHTLLSYQHSLASFSCHAILVMRSLMFHPLTQLHRINLQSSWNSAVSMLMLECAQQLELVLPLVILK